MFRQARGHSPLELPKSASMLWPKQTGGGPRTVAGAGSDVEDGLSVNQVEVDVQVGRPQVDTLRRVAWQGRESEGGRQGGSVRVTNPPYTGALLQRQS